MSEVYYFGRWNGPGHYLYRNVGWYTSTSNYQRVLYFGDRVHIDGNLAPRRVNETDNIVFGGQGKTIDDRARARMRNRSQECDQGQFLLHALDNGFTAIQWWDRCQGDKRGACNSTILLAGERTAGEMLSALDEHFPSVRENLKRAGIDLVQVFATR